jgi:hypothetical protein
VHDRTARAPARRHPLARPPDRHEDVGIPGAQPRPLSLATVVDCSAARSAKVLADTATGVCQP